MTTPSEVYGRTLRGQRLAAIVDDPDRCPEYRAFSREGFPAVTALVSLVKPELEALRHSDRREFDPAERGPDLLGGFPATRPAGRPRVHLRARRNEDST